MACINPNSREFKAALKKTGNPLLAEIEVDNVEVSYQLPQGRELEEFVASEKTIRDLAARISDRIGIPVQFESDRTKKYKGKIEKGFKIRQVQVSSDETVYEYGDNKDTAVINLAYATLDTPIHEILGHPIIRAIKNINQFNGSINEYNDFMADYWEANPTKSREEVIKYVDENFKRSRQPKIFLENFNKIFFDQQDERINTGKTIVNEGVTYKVYKLKKYTNVRYIAYNFERNTQIKISEEEFNNLTSESELYKNLLKELEYGKGKEVFDRIKRDYVNKPSKFAEDAYGIQGELLDESRKYTLEEQQEEALVELLGLYTAGRLDNVKDGKLISLLKRLLKEMKAFMKSLIRQKEVEIDKLPDDMTLGDIADLLAYSNSKLILPGNEVVYTTPDNKSFKSYGEASKHISDLAKSAEAIDLDKVKLEIPTYTKDKFNNDKEIKRVYSTFFNEEFGQTQVINVEYVDGSIASYDYDDLPQEKYSFYIDLQTNYEFDKRLIDDFISRNEEYEQSKEIIDEWKKVNNIVYNPEEVYSRGQEFVSVVGAYSDFDVNLMMQNLLQHIEDNERAGGKFAISAFTKPVDKKIGHLEGGGGKIKFKIYPKPNDILWASNIDVYSGSVWDAGLKVNKDKKSELLGVSYTKYPSLNYLDSVQPNLAAIIDDLRHHHNELGIQLTGGNFRLEYDSNIPTTTKKIVDSINSILDQRYGKLVKPRIEKQITGLTYVAVGEYNQKTKNSIVEEFKTKEEAVKWIEENKIEYEAYTGSELSLGEFWNEGVQATQTVKTLKESLDRVAYRVSQIYKEGNTDGSEGSYYVQSYGAPKKEYTSQALINTKISKLKEVARKYPRSLIRSEVLNLEDITYGGVFDDSDDLPFQRIPSTSQSDMLQKSSDRTLPSNASPATLKLIKDFLKQVGVDVRILTEINVNGVKQDANGVAQVMQKLISVVEGKEAQALPEEAMHFAVAIIKQTDPKLYQKLLKEINGYEMLKEVYKSYGNDPLYQKDGKPDIIKLKEEAIAKVLVNKIIGKVEGVAETSENTIKAQSWWKSIVEWFKNLLYQKSGFDQAVIDIISGKKIGTADDIREEEGATYLQQSKQDKVYNTLKDIHNRLDKKVNSEGVEKYLFDGNEIKYRVTDFAKGSYERWMQRNNIPKSEADQYLDDLRKEKGTAGHSDFEQAFKLFVDENGYLKSKADRESLKLSDPHQSFTEDQAIYKTLRDNLEKRLESYPEKTRFLSEVRVYNGQNTAGTIDFIAITPDGKINILDWKFMSLDTEKYKDVPYYKIDSWNIQMNQYRNILKLNYGIESNDFGETRMIPIVAKYSKGKRNKEGQYTENPKLIGIKIGDVDVAAIIEDESYLLPVPTPEESTGDLKVDKLIGRLNEMYEKFSKQKVDPEERSEKALVLNTLFGAIRKLQVKRDAKPLISQVRILNTKIDKLIKEYDSKYKGVDPTTISEIEKSTFLKELNDAEYATRTYSEINKALRDIVKDDKDLYNELLEIADVASDYKDALERIEKEFVSEVTAKEEGFKNFLNPEKLVTKLSGWFGSTSTLQIKSVQLLFRKANRALGKASFSTEEKNTKLLQIKEQFMQWAKSKGLSNKQLFSFIKKKDKNELINQYEPKFYQDLARAVKDNDIDWMKANLDIEAVKESMAKRKEQEYERISNRGRDGSLEEQAAQVEAERRKADKDYNIDNASSFGWYKKDILQKHPKKEKWETQEWKTLNKPENAPAKALYDYIIEQNNEFASLGYISKKEARVFLPFVRSTLIESAVTGNKLSVGDRFWRSISVDEGDVGYGQLDPDTGQPMNTVPIYFTKEFEDGDYSEDLFKNMALYNESAYRYKYLTEIEEQVRAIARVERNKKTIQTSIFGNAKIVNNEVQYNPVGAAGASANVELLDSMIKAIIYGQKYVDNAQFDAVLLKLGEWGKTFNEKIGINVFPENIEGSVTLNKVVDTLNNSFQLVTLGANIGSSISNFFGGAAQSLIKAGKYYTVNDFVAAEQQIFVNKFNGEDKLKFVKAIEYFMPFTDNYNREIMKELSVASITDEGFQDLIMAFMKGADRAVQTGNFYAFLNNTIVIDGRIVNAREYLRSKPEYQNRYQKSSEERAALDEKFEKEVKLLIQDLGVMKIAKIENGRMVIPGIDRMSNDVLDIRRKVQQLSKDAMGNLSEDDLRTINMNILGKSMMVFKNWIPRLVDVRLGALKYNAASDAYEWGRIRMIISVLTDRMYTSLGELNDLLAGNDRGMEILRKSYEKLRDKHFQETGENLELTEEMFIELFRENVRAAVRDLALLASLFALTVAIKAATPDDEEDKAVLNQWRYASKITDKLLDELMYFYNPTSILNLVGSGPFPAMSLINNGFKLLSNFLSEMLGIVTGDEERREDAKVIKYLMKTFPFTNQIVGYLPMFYPDMAKDLGIRMQSNYGIR